MSASVIAQPGGDRRGTRSRGFTLLELLFSILIIGILMGLLGLSAVHIMKTARVTADRQMVKSIQAGISEFQKEFGFIPPLMKEQHDVDEATGTPNPSTVVTAGRARVDIYLNALNADVDELHGVIPPGEGAQPDNPLRDPRFSTRSLAVYLAGALNIPVTAASTVPMDGIAGPGLYKPNQDGTFTVPADVRNASTTSARTTGAFQPFVSLGKTPKLYSSVVSPFKVELRDSRDAPIRYYRWLQGREEPAGSRKFVIETPADLNVPPMVARDHTNTLYDYFKKRPERDLLSNAAVRGASYAVVSAGPNRVFGDESRVELGRRLGHGDPGAWTPALELKYRAEAEEDNIVEVGQ